MNAIYNGGLANKPQFFGSSTAETVSAATGNGSWNGDFARSATSGNPWFRFSGRTDDSIGAPGIFASYETTGGAGPLYSHRTILSGY